MKFHKIALFLAFLLLALGRTAAAQVSDQSEPVRMIPPIGHTKYVTDISPARSGSFLASCSWDNSALLWETSTGRILRRLPLQSKGRWVRFTDSDLFLLTADDQNRVSSWDRETGRLRWTAQTPLAIESVSVRPDGKTVAISGSATAGNKPLTVVYQSGTGNVLQTFGADSEISQRGTTETRYSSDGAMLYGWNALDYFTYQDAKNAAPIPLFSFDTVSGKQLKTFSATGAAIACSSDGKFLLTRNKTSVSWRNARSGAVLKLFQKEMQGKAEPQKIALSPDSSRFATVTNGGDVSIDGTIREYSTVTGDLLHKTIVHGIDSNSSFSYLPDRRIGGDRGLLITLNEGQTAFCQVAMETDSVTRLFRGGEGVFQTPTVLSPDGRTVFLSNGTQTGVIGWDVTKHTTSNLFFFPSDKKSKNEYTVLAESAVSRDGHFLVTPGVSNRHVFVSDLRTGKTTADIRLTIASLAEGAALHPAGEWIAIPVGGTDYHDSVKLFSAGGILLRDIQPPFSASDPLSIRCVAPDATGDRILVSDNDGTLFVYEARTGKLLSTVPPKTRSSREAITAIAAVGDEKDRVILSRESGQVAELDLATGQVSSINSGELMAGRVLAATTPDGRLAALGRSDGSIALWRRGADSQVLLTGHTGRIRSLAFSPDGRQLTSLGSDGTVRFWSVKTGREQASLLVYSQQPSRLSSLLLDSARADREDIQADIPQWIVYNANGFFEGSEAATRQIHFARGTRTYSADQFFERYYRAGLLASVMTNADTNPVPTPQGDLAEALRVGAPPSIRILPPVANGKSAPSTTVLITVNATEQAGGGVKAIRFYQNGRLIGGPSALRGIAVEAVSGATTTKVFSVSLTAGENTFRAVAYSKSDVESIPASLTLKYAPPQIARPNLYVLVVGINAYKDSTMNLAYARPDADSLADFFEKPGSSASAGALFDTVKVSRLTDTDATSAAITRGLTAVAASAKPDDVVFLYFAGHGETADGIWYFLPHEMRQMALPERVRELGIPWSQIETAVGKIAARKIVIVVDACKSGAALSGALRGVDDESQTMAVMARAQGIHILTAATGQQYAAEVKELGHGILTYALLEGLNGKATASGGVMVRTLMSYVEDRVPELSKKYRGSEQYPVPFERGQNFPLAGSKK